MEKIDIQILINDLMTDKDFKLACEDESVKWAMSLYLGDAEYDVGDFPVGSQFELVDAYSEKGDGYQEETAYGIFKRKSDGKYFKMWVHDAGLIGSSTLTLCQYMEEVKPKKKKITTWEDF